MFFETLRISLTSLFETKRIFLATNCLYHHCALIETETKSQRKAFFISIQRINSERIYI